MPCFGFAEHRPDQPVEQVDRLVGQTGGEIEADSDQGGVPALTLKAGHILHRGAAGFADKLSETRLMNPMSTRRVNPRQPDGFRRSISPSIAMGFAASGIWRIQASQLWLVPHGAASIYPIGAVIGGQSIGQTAMDCPPRLVAGLNAEPLERAR